MARVEQGKFTRLNRDWTKKRSGIAAPISLEDLMEKEMQSSLQEGAIRELSVLSGPSNEYSTNIKWKICILDHPKNLMEVLCARLVIAQGLTGNNIGEALRIFDLKPTELRHETVANLNLVINHVDA